MKTYNQYFLLRLFLIGSFALVTLLFTFSNVQAAEHCSDDYYVNETLPNGASWDMCWEHRQREGIIFHHIFYTPKDGQRRMVLNHAAVAQIHVPYDDNGARYHDISDYGIGGLNILGLNSDECPSGSLLDYSGKNVLCKQEEKRQFAHKSGNNSSSGHSLSLFSVSPVGAYYYIPTWRFMDDGTIEPWIGATGALQRFGTNQSRGWKLGDDRVGISHLHNFYWKLDFDLNGTHLDDVVEEINFSLVNGKRQRTISEFNTEASRKVNPDTMRHWRVRDNTLNNLNNHSVSYDILLNESGHQDIGPASEPFTHNDFYVTKQRNEEKFASHNPSGGKNLAEFTNGENISGQDIVIWAGVTFYHMPRSEDAPHMDAHWSHLRIVPRDWHASNPLGSEVNTPPTIATLVNQNLQVGNAVNLTVQASDIDGDSLSYSATGLPSGLQINSGSGLISGILTTAGNYTTVISVSDGTDSSTAQFEWTITAATNNPPQITSPTNQSGLVGENVNLVIQASDSDGDSLNYSASGLPAGLQISNTTGVISGNLSGAGNYSVTITVSDSVDSVNAQFSWDVTAPTGFVSNEVSNASISIDGLISEWAGITYFANDPDDISGSNNQIDWLKVGIAHSPNNVFMVYQNRQSVDPGNNSGSYIPWGWQAFIDADNNASTGYVTGSIGADFVINGNIIERYVGTGTSWSWDVVAATELQYFGNNVEIRFSRALIGNPQSMQIKFVGDNAAFNGSSADQYPDTGYFTYNFTGASSPNTPPVASNQQISVGSGASISVTLAATDVDSNPLTYQLTQQPLHGSLSGSIPNLVYTADSSYLGSDSFKFKANDGIVDSQVATININITSGQNSAFSNFVSTAINVDGSNSEWNGLIRFVDDADDASGNIDWKNVTFAHDQLKFYLLYNNHGNIDPDSTTGSYLAWGWTTYIDSDKDASTGYKTGPIGADYMVDGNQIERYTGSGDNWSWEHLGAVESQYSGNIAELALPLTQIGSPNSIRVVFSGDSESYGGSGLDLYPDGQNNSQASIQYFEYDFTGGSGPNDRPVAFTQSVTVDADTSINITLLASDPDNDTLTYNIISNPSNGSVSGTAPDVTYTPTSNFVGQDSFSFNVSDGNSVSATAVVNINVTGVQNGVFSNLVSSITIDGNNEEWSGLSAFDQDGDDISGTNNVIDWQRAAFAHNASTLYFMYQNYNAINADVNSGNFINWGWQTYIDTDENYDTGYKIGTIGADYIIEGAQLHSYTGNGANWSWNNFTSATLSYNANTAELGFARSLIGNPNKIRVVFIGDNESYGGSNIDTYPNALNYFEYQLTGGTQTSSNRPVASSLTVNVTQDEQETINLSASDQDNDSLSFRLVSQPNHGSISGFNGSTPSLNYQPENGYTGTDSFRYIANDGTFDSSIRTVTLNVSAASNYQSGGGGSMPIEWLVLLGMIPLIRRRK